jgi:hypothetical protein
MKFILSLFRSIQGFIIIFQNTLQLGIKTWKAAEGFSLHCNKYSQYYWSKKEKYTGRVRTEDLRFDDKAKFSSATLLTTDPNGIIFFHSFSLLSVFDCKNPFPDMTPEPTL